MWRQYYHAVETPFENQGKIRMASIINSLKLKMAASAPFDASDSSDSALEELPQDPMFDDFVDEVQEMEEMVEKVNEERLARADRRCRNVTVSAASQPLENPLERQLVRQSSAERQPVRQFHAQSPSSDADDSSSLSSPR